MKIGFVFDDSLDKTDGVQQYVLSLGSWFESQGHEVHYLVGQTKRRDLPRVHSLSRNIGVRFNGNRLSIPLPAGRRRISKLLTAEQFDVLHVQIPYSPWLAQRIIRQAPPATAIIGTFHVAPYSWLAMQGARLLGFWTRRSLRRFQAIVSVSSAAAMFGRRTYRLETAVLPNVVDYQRFHDARPLPQYADDALTVVFLGRLVPRKGCQRLLQALTQLQSALPELPAFRVVLCGTGPQETALRQYALEHGLSELVTFAGYISEAEKPRYLASAEIAVFPSSGGESFGIVLIEAMSSGRAAVLGGDNPGYRTVLAPRPELLFSPQDSKALAKKLQHFLTDAAARRDAAAWGAAAARQYDTATVGAQLLALYGEKIALMNSSR